jgi:hypothetical protein
VLYERRDQYQRSGLLRRIRRRNLWFGLEPRGSGDFPSACFWDTLYLWRGQLGIPQKREDAGGRQLADAVKASWCA